MDTNKPTMKPFDRAKIQQLAEVARAAQQQVESSMAPHRLPIEKLVARRKLPWDGDDTSYQPASKVLELLVDVFPTMKSLHKFIDRTKGKIRHRQQNKRRWSIHIGDLLTFLDQKQTADPGDLSAETVDKWVQETRERYQAIYRRKTGN